MHKRKIKSDMDRAGVFQEMSYITIGDPYIPRRPDKFFRSGKQLITDSFKAKCADQSGYFSPKFLRLSEGDPYKTLADIYRMKDREAVMKSLAGPFYSGGLVKMDCGKGSFCATINPCPTAMSPLKKTDKKPDFKFAFLSSPGKKGTGYGYLDITIGPYVPAKNPKEKDPSDVRKEEFKTHSKKMLDGPFHNIFPSDKFFDMSLYQNVKMKKRKLKEIVYKSVQHPKKFLVPALPSHDHGFKYSTINKFPTYEQELYKDPPSLGYPKKKDIRNKSNTPYLPPSGSKSRPVFSTIQINLNKRLSGDNYNCLDSVVGFISC